MSNSLIVPPIGMIKNLKNDLAIKIIFSTTTEPSYTLNAGETKFITVSTTPTDTGYQWTLMNINTSSGNVCVNDISQANDFYRLYNHGSAAETVEPILHWIGVLI